MARYSKPSELIVCDLCGKQMRSRGYGNHLLQAHKMKLTQVSETKRPHVSEKPAHVSGISKKPHVSEKKSVTVVSSQVVTTKRVYTPELPNIWGAPDKPVLS